MLWYMWRIVMISTEVAGASKFPGFLSGGKKKKGSLESQDSVYGQHELNLHPITTLGRWV